MRATRLASSGLSLLLLLALPALVGPAERVFRDDASRCAAWQALRTRHGLAADPHGCHEKARDEFDVLLLPRAGTTDPGADFEADVVLWFGAAADAVAVRVEGTGALAGASDAFERVGRWQAGDAFDFPVRVARSPGRGALLVHATVLGEDDRPLRAAASEIFVLNEGDRTWWSPLGHADLDLSRASQLAAGGELDAAGLTAAREAAVGSLVAVDTTPAPERPPTHVEKELDAAFAHQKAQATSTAVAAGDSGHAVAAATANITVKGRVRFADSAGVLQAAAYAKVEVRDDDLIGSELVASTLTDSTGRYEVTFDHDDGIGAGDPDLFVRAIARTGVAAVSPTTDPDDAYFVQSATFDETPTGTTLDVNFDLDDKSDDAHTAFSVHTGLVWIAWYSGQLAGAMPSQLRVKFPSTGSNMTTDGTGPFMNLLRLDRFDWDVLHHEYGHYMTRIHGLSGSPGGPHSLGDNLWDRRGNKSEGLRLAWGEGWPSFFGTVGQRAAGLQALGIPNVGDVRYTDTEDSTNDYSLETGIASGPGNGEDNEISVQTFMWDLYDGAGDGLDESSFRDRFLFDTLKAAGTVTIGGAWEAIAATQTTEGKTLIGGALAQARVAPELTDPPDQLEVDPASPPTFKWKKNGAGAPNPLDDFKIVFYKSDFSSVIFEKELGDVAQYTPSNGEWNTILGDDPIVKWVVEGRNTAAPSTPGGDLDRYWSNARSLGGSGIAFVIDDTGSMSEEIEGVQAALQAYIDLLEASLGEDEEPPTIQLITFKDSVSTRATTNDLETIRAAVGSLSANGGGDCPEYSAQALQVASQSVSAGGTILFATDASSQPGVDVATVIANLRAKGVTVNTILSGDCSGLGAAKASATADQLNPSGSQGETLPSQKPGADENPDDPIVDPGQPLLDVHGNTKEDATRIQVDAPPVLGSVENPFDAGDPDGYDWFAVELEAGVPYAIQHEYLGGGSGYLILFDDAGVARRSANIDPFSPSQTLFTPSASGDYFIQIEGYSAVTYHVSVTTDPLGAIGSSALSLFSTISAQTGGAFVVRDDVNSGNSEAYVAAMFNIMATTLGPGVLSANPSELPRNTELVVTLTGRNTNWRGSSEVSFSGDGVDIESVSAVSATRLEVLVEIDPAAELGFRDVTVTTPLGGGTEKAKGTAVIEIVSEPVFPTTLSVEPSTVDQDSSVTVLIRGVLTNWAEDETTVEVFDQWGFALDGAITVDDVTVLSETLVEADLTVAEDAALGFRTVRVTSGFQPTQKNRALLVQVSGVAIPEIDSVLPRAGTPGETVDVSVDASHTGFLDGVTTASFGPGIDVLSVDVSSATEAVVQIAIAEDASPGFRDVVLDTGGESAALLDGFYVGQLVDVSELPENGKFSGCVAPGGESLFSFDVPVNRAIKKVSLEGIKVKGEGGKLKNGELVLVDPLGGEDRLGKLKKGKKKKIKDNNIRLLLAGEHQLAIRDTDGKGGCFKGKAKVEPTQGNIKFGACLGTDEDFELFFSAEPGSTVTKLVVEGTKKKNEAGGKLDPEVTLEAPSEASEEFESGDSGKKVVVKDHALGEAGDWRLEVEGRDGDAGCFKGMLKLQQGAAD
ncbi:MAG: VWA domain-containing protein [Myxococcota bacterium]